MIYIFIEYRFTPVSYAFTIVIFITAFPNQLDAFNLLRHMLSSHKVLDLDADSFTSKCAAAGLTNDH